ncbi:ABC transporter permease subunit [haloarchaeon 3A1-DGR]|nr:ABC transporter permease subunit [haloarchaeon 3A1-DGR]
MDNRVTIARREIAGLRAEKTILLALGIQLFIAAFSSFLVVGLVSMYDPGALEGAQVETAVTGEAVAELEAAAADVEGVRARPYADSDAAAAAFADGRVDAVLVGTRRDGRIHVDATVPDSNVETTVIVVQLRSVLRTLEAAERDRRSDALSRPPLAVPDGGTSAPYYGFTYTVLVPVLVFVPAFISGSLTIDSITEEIDRGTLELLRVTPATLVEIVDGKALAAIGLVPAQVALWLGLLRLNGTSVAGVGRLLVLATAVAGIVVGIAAALAFLLPDRRAAQICYAMAMLALFGGASLLPRNPVNATARLAVDGADAGVTLTVGLVAGAAVAVVAVTRTIVVRAGP